VKFLKAEAFEKHLGDALPDHLSPLYLLLLSDPFERDFLAKRISRALDISHSYLQPDSLLEEINSPSLFSERRVIICDEIEKLKIDSLPLPPKLVLILMGKEQPTFYESVKKEAIILDLSKEKPWERKTRIERWLLESAKSRGKKLAADAIAYLLEYGMDDFASLVQELEKALLFSDDKKEITLETLKKVTSLAPSQTGWQLSEALIWGGALSRRSIQELDDIYGLIGQIRYQLNLGLTIASGEEPPKLSPKRLDKLRPLAKKLTLTYFSDGLKMLFDLELKMRSGITDHILLIDYYYAKLTLRRHALSAP